MARQRVPKIQGQLDLFPELIPVDEVAQEPPGSLVRQWGGSLPERLWVGTSSWSFPGWRGLIYDQGHRYTESRLSREGLKAYSSHPLLRAVGIDRGFYAPIPEDDYRRYADQVPEHFRFVVKGPSQVTMARFPRMPRYGEQAGLDNPDFLRADVAMADWIEPARAGLGDKLGVLLLQFSPSPAEALQGFAYKLHHFLEQLPDTLQVAIELRNRDLLTPAYFQVLQRLGVAHCLNVHPNMPPIERQLELAGPQPFLMLRWMLGSPVGFDNWNYAIAEERYKPFDRLVDEDLEQRAAIVRIWRSSLEQGLSVFTTVSNEAEGCAPLSIERLAEEWFDPPAPF